MVKAAAVETSLSKSFPFGRVQLDVKMKRKTPSELSEEEEGKRLKQVIPREIIDVDEYDNPEVVFIGASTSDYKKKQPMKFGKGFDMQLKDDLSTAGSSKNHMFDNVAHPQLDAQKSSKLVSHDFNFAGGYNYDGWEDGYDYNDYEDGHYRGFEFDSDVGVNDHNNRLSAKFDGLDVSQGLEENVPLLQQPALEKSTTIQSKVVVVDPTSQLKVVVDDMIDLKFKAFKQFDIVRSVRDHYFADVYCVTGFDPAEKPSKDWVKRIQHEWKVLKENLPEMIYVRVYEGRMDILRAVIVGPAGSPYHDGLFFFDAYFPPSYPRSPPKVHYYSHELELNPNLHDDGKVCISILSTSHGLGCENWSPSRSTMLQVLVSIQGLVLNAMPYFNDQGGLQGEDDITSCLLQDLVEPSLRYNEEAFLLSCRTMLYTLRSPLAHFKDFIVGHFRKHGQAILEACRAYLGGAQVGCLVAGVQDVDEGHWSCSEKFRTSLKALYDEMQREFAVKRKVRGTRCSVASKGKDRKEAGKCEKTKKGPPPKLPKKMKSKSTSQR